MQKIRVSLLQKQDVGLVLAEEGDTRRVDGPQFFQVLFEVIRHEAGGVLQRFQEVRLELVLGGAEPVHGAAVERAGDGEHAVEVVVLLQHEHHLEHAPDDGHALLRVVRLQDGLLQVAREVGGVPHHPQQVGAALVLVLADPGQVHQLTGLHCLVILELYQRQLPRNLDGVIGQKLGPVVLRILDVGLDLRRRSVKVEDNLLDRLVVVESPLDDLADALHPLPHGLPRDLIQERGQLVEEIRVFREIVEMLVHPMLKNRKIKTCGYIILN